MLLDAKLRKGCLQLGLAGKWRPYKGGATTLLSVGGPVSVFQVVERRCGTINKSACELRGRDVLCKTSMSSGLRSRIRGYAAVWRSWEVTVDSTIHDKKFDLWPRGAGDRPLRQEFRTR